MHLAHKATNNQTKDAKTKRHYGDSNKPGELEFQLQQNQTIPLSSESLKQSANKKVKKHHCILSYCAWH